MALSKTFCLRNRTCSVLPGKPSLPVSSVVACAGRGGEVRTSSRGARFTGWVPRMAGVAAIKAAVPGNLTGATTGQHQQHFEPSVWGDFFVTYTPPPSQRSEEWMRQRADQLKGQVRRMFMAGKPMSVTDTLSLVDTLQRLGVDNHFHEEIDAALSRIHSEGEDFDSSNDLHIVALRFCLLRQHGFWVPADVFYKFKDSVGNFRLDLTTDPRGLLSLYNAAHMAVPGETALDDAIAFARSNLEIIKDKLGSPMAEQLFRAFEIPRPRFMRRLEAMHYITEYEQEEAHDVAILEFAKLDFNLARSIHLKELMRLSLWWRDLYDDVKLTYARDRIVEAYFYANGWFHEVKNSRVQIILTKVFGVFTLIDDTYDTHATLEECRILNEAIQRWDESMVPILPDYLRVLYIKLLGTSNEIEDILEPWEKYRMAYIIKMFKLQSKNYLKEAEWLNKNYTPSFKEQVDLSAISSGSPLLILVALVGLGQRVTKEAFDWALDIPDMVRACSEIGRFLNDIASYKYGKSKMDGPSSLECYIKQYGVTVEDAIAAFSVMIEHAWRRVNLACMELDRGILPTARVVVDMTRAMEIWHFRGKDTYTFGSSLKERVSSLFLKDFPV